MLNRRVYLITSTFGLVVMALGQILARPQFYGTEFGRAWAHVFWFGFFLFFGSLLTWFTRYIAHHKNPRVVDAGKYQVAGVIGVTGMVVLVAIAAIIMGNDAGGGSDGKGAFVIWLTLLLAFTMINLGILVFRQLKLPK